MVESAPQQGPGKDKTTVREMAAFGGNMRQRVQGIVLGANIGLTDGTPQPIGDHVVRITLTPTGENGEVRNTFSIDKDGKPFGEYSKISNETGATVGDITKLHKEVDGSPVTLTLTRILGQQTSLTVSVPSPDQVLPGRVYSRPIGEHDPAYIARVRQAFGI